MTGLRAATVRRRAVDRRGFLLASATGLVAAGVNVRTASAATDDDLAFGNFGLAAEFLAADFYRRALAGGRLGAAARPMLRRGRAVAALHARALSEMLAGAADAPATSADFEFVWPRNAFSTARNTRTTGLAVLRPILGAYQGAAVGASQQYRTLFASLAASVGEQVGIFAAPAGAASIQPFPVALDLEAATAALESYLG